MFTYIFNKSTWALAVVFSIGFSGVFTGSCYAKEATKKISPQQALDLLKAGNARFVKGKSIHPNTGLDRLKLAGSKDQGDYAYATVITCSDSRVPVERLFDAGVMDLFVIRVAGNVCDTDECGSIEYGMAHVHTPVLVVMGHTQCGAVTAVTNQLQGNGHALERNIPPLIDNIVPAVKRAIATTPKLTGNPLVERGVEENIWQGIEDLFMGSPSVREMVAKESAKVVGAIYDVGTGKIRWLSEAKVYRILGKVEANPKRAERTENPHKEETHHVDAHAKHHSEPHKTQNHKPVIHAEGGHTEAHAAQAADYSGEQSAHDSHAAEGGHDAHPKKASSDAHADHDQGKKNNDSLEKEKKGEHGDEKEKDGAGGAAGHASDSDAGGGRSSLFMLVAAVFVLGVGLLAGSMILKRKGSAVEEGEDGAEVAPA